MEELSGSQKQSSRGLSWTLCCAQSYLTLCNPWDCGPQAPLSMGFSRQEYWSELPFPLPGNLPDPGIKLVSCALALQVDSLPAKPWRNPSRTEEILFFFFSDKRKKKEKPNWSPTFHKAYRRSYNLREKLQGGYNNLTTNMAWRIVVTKINKITWVSFSKISLWNDSYKLELDLGSTS